ncbi:B-cell linker protein-like [Heterodontus francisci]|uniref:B-cell linker protein-like n=1 Tax=Heterodontus francisci TaxID=7792 RepID=UPI00355C24C7
MNLPKPWNLKNMSSLPPPLPTRPKKPRVSTYLLLKLHLFGGVFKLTDCYVILLIIDHQDEQTWSENELENGSEDEDTYEPPPVERPLRTVTTIEPTNNNDYIERSVLTKTSASLPRPAPKLPADLPKVQNIKSDSEPASIHHPSIDPNIAKGSLMNKVFQNTPPILPPRSHRQSQLLTPVEDMDDGEYLELDPIESRGSKNLPDPRPKPSIPSRGVNLPTPVTKPPVPIGKSVSIVPELCIINNSIKIATEKCRFYRQLAKELQSVKLNSLLLCQLHSSKVNPSVFVCSASFSSMQEGPLGNTSSGLISSPSMFAENTNLPSKPWYASNRDRKTAEAVLRENGKDGAFLVRPSSGCGRNQPYTLAVLYRRKVYNIPIRFIEGSNQYVLGKEKAGEMWFNSVRGMIDYYQQNSLILIDQQNNTKDSTLLLHPVRL